MYRQFVQEVTRIESICNASADDIKLLARVPPTVDKLRVAVAALEKKGCVAAARELTKVFTLEEKLKAVADAERRGMSASVVPGADGALDAAGDVASLLPLDHRLALAYRDMIHAFAADAEARAVLSAHSDMVGTGVHAAESIVKVGQAAVRRLTTARQQAVITQAGGADAQARITVAERDIALLTEELTRKRRAATKERSLLDRQLGEVRDDIAALVKASDGAYNAAQAERTSSVASLANEHESAMSALETELARLQADYAAMVSQHADAESAQRKRRARAFEEAEAATKEFDTTLETLSASIETLEGEIASDAPIVADLKQYFEKSEAEAHRRKQEAHDAYWAFLHKMEDHVINVVLAVARIKIWWAAIKARDPTKGTGAAAKLRKAAEAAQSRGKSAPGTAAGAPRGMTAPGGSRTGTPSGGKRPGSAASKK